MSIHAPPLCVLHTLIHASKMDLIGTNLMLCSMRCLNEIWDNFKWLSMT